MTIEVDMAPSALKVLELHAREAPQKDDLCGAFWGMVALKLGGLEQAEQDDVAVAAGSVIRPFPDDHDRAPGAPPRRDYVRDLPQTGDSRLAGTAASGVSSAIEELSGGELAVLPVSGPWDDRVLDAVLTALRAGGTRTLVVANVATRYLWGARPRADQVLRYLQTGDDDGPRPDWDVGHFVAILGSIAGQVGRLVILADTYPELGNAGVHLQPMARLRAALEREDRAPGGLLVAAPAQRVKEIERVLRAAGARIELWDNGTPAPGGST